VIKPHPVILARSLRGVLVEGISGTATQLFTRGETSLSYLRSSGSPFELYFSEFPKDFMLPQDFCGSSLDV